MKTCWLVAVGIVLNVMSVKAADLPATVMDDPALLAKTRQQLISGGGPKQAIEKLKDDAERCLDIRPGSVMDKKMAGPSGDKHDYVSYAPYFWEDPKDPKAAYIRKDGHRNADLVANGDAPQYERLTAAVHTLGLAYYYTGDQRYAMWAAKLARTWFLDPKTAMNPNFQFAQAIPNLVTGRGTGLIEDRGLVGCLDGLTLITGTKFWSVDDNKAMRAWAEKFDKWMTTSDEGLAEKAAKNNHGSWYAVQETGLYLYLGKTDKAKEVLEGVKDRISKQIEPDGTEPLELARADGFSYSVFNVQALSTLATLAQREKIDLWNYETEGRGLRKAINYLLPYADEEQKWPGNQIKKIGPQGMIPVVLEAWKVYPDNKPYRAWLEKNKDAVVASGSMLGGEE